MSAASGLRPSPPPRGALARALGLAALLCAGLAGCGGPVLYAEVEIPRFCFTPQPDVYVPGVPPGVAFGLTLPPIGVSLENVVPLLRVQGNETVFRFTELRLTPISGAPDLSGVQRGVVRLVRRSGERVELLRYDRDPAAPAPAELVLTGDRTTDVSGELVAGSVPLEIEFQGAAPARDWHTSLRLCANGRSKVPYGP